MTLPTLLYFSSILLTCLLTGFLAWYAWRQPPAPGVRMYALMVLSESLMALVDLLSMLGGTTMQAAFWFKLRYSFSAIIPVFWLIFALEYNGRKSWLSKGLRVWLCIIPAITLVMQLTNGLHGLWIKQDVSFAQSGGLWIAETSARIPGLWFMVHSFYGLILLLAGVGIILFAAWQKGRLHRLQAILISIGALIALGTTLIPVFNLLPQLKFNLYIPGIGISAVLYALAILRFQFLKRSPAQEGIQSNSRLNAPDRRSLATLIFVFILFTSGIAAASYLTYKNYEKQFRAQVNSQLSAIADLKVSELQVWRAERMADGLVLSNNPAFAALVQSYFDNPQDGQTQAEIQAWLKNYQLYGEYSRVRLLDLQGTTRLSAPEDLPMLSPEITQRIPEVLRSAQVTLVDFYRDEADQHVYLTVLVPVLNAGAENRVLGFVALRIDPEVYLYPYIQNWPVPSASAETLLVRRDGQDALYLNDLRFAQDDALNLHAPLTSTTLPAVKAILGETGIVEGVDYRGIPVIADLRAVPDSPWFLVSKMDTSEVFAPLTTRLWQTVVFFAMLILVAGAGLVFLWRQQRMRFFREQMKTVDTLRESEEKFRKAFMTSPDSVNINQLQDGMFISINPGFTQIMGYTEAEAIGKTSLELEIWENPEERRQLVEGLRKDGFVGNLEATFHRKDGSTIIGLMSASVIQLGGVAHILSITRDITERKQTEDKLLASEMRYRRLFEAAKDGILILDADTGTIVDANPFLVEMLGFSHAEFLGKKIWDLGFFKDIVASHANFMELQAKDFIRYEDLPLETADDQSLDIEFTGNAFQVGNRRVFQCTIRDITERKLAERILSEYSTRLEAEVGARTRELENAQEKLVRQERLAVLGQLAGSVGHELRNPLGVISNAAYFLQLAQPDASEKVKEYLQIIDKEVRTSEKIITDLLDFSRIKSMDQTLTDITTLVEQTLKRHPAPPEVSIRRQIAKDLPQVFADTQQMVQVLGNLLTNAFQAMDNRGKVTISARQDGNMVAVSVKDTGPGISPDNMQKLFEPLFTTKLRGIGLGLAVSQRFVEANGGRLEVHSEAGKGSTFIVYIPIQTKVADE